MITPDTEYVSLDEYSYDDLVDLVYMLGFRAEGDETRDELVEAIEHYSTSH